MNSSSLPAGMSADPAAIMLASRFCSMAFCMATKRSYVCSKKTDSLSQLRFSPSCMKALNRTNSPHHVDLIEFFARTPLGFSKRSYSLLLTFSQYDVLPWLYAKWLFFWFFVAGDSISIQQVTFVHITTAHTSFSIMGIIPTNRGYTKLDAYKTIMVYMNRAYNYHTKTKIINMSKK
ncbi:unnamed protein product [Trypanosoma congolense IL3000]|uniref:WGS project CAEQ00000000 data, annotated contig 423 n=1 Tax=Trypanosoma congolense (strain IL3000) TaxID=1068625 RepID=F9WFU0_TRYCI|nr:unnamed protein product [Trypanosoma congolense IL3000]